METQLWIHDLDYEATLKRKMDKPGFGFGAQPANECILGSIGLALVMYSQHATTSAPEPGPARTND